MTNPNTNKVLTDSGRIIGLVSDNAPVDTIVEYGQRDGASILHVIGIARVERRSDVAIQNWLCCNSDRVYDI